MLLLLNSYVIAQKRQEKLKTAEIKQGAVHMDLVGPDELVPFSNRLTFQNQSTQQLSPCHWHAPQLAQQVHLPAAKQLGHGVVGGHRVRDERAVEDVEHSDVL
jgi:hypothetical protein